MHGLYMSFFSKHLYLPKNLIPHGRTPPIMVEYENLTSKSHDLSVSCRVEAYLWLPVVPHDIPVKMLFTSLEKIHV